MDEIDEIGETVRKKGENRWGWWDWWKGRCEGERKVWNETN